MPALTLIPISSASPERYRALLGERYSEVEKAIETARQLLAGRVVWHVNSTPRGGSVAEMLQSLLAYSRAAGVDTRWDPSRAGRIEAAAQRRVRESFLVTRHLVQHMGLIERMLTSDADGSDG